MDVVVADAVLGRVTHPIASSACMPQAAVLYLTTYSATVFLSKVGRPHFLC